MKKCMTNFGIQFLAFSGVFFRGNSLTRIEDESDELQSENTEADASIAPYDSKRTRYWGQLSTRSLFQFQFLLLLTNMKMTEQLNLRVRKRKILKHP